MRDKLAMSSVEKIVDTFVVDEWTSVARLYAAVVHFAGVYESELYVTVMSCLDCDSCSVVNCELHGHSITDLLIV